MRQCQNRAVFFPVVEVMPPRFIFDEVCVDGRLVVAGWIEGRAVEVVEEPPAEAQVQSGVVRRSEIILKSAQLSVALQIQIRPTPKRLEVHQRRQSRVIHRRRRRS